MSTLHAPLDPATIIGCRGRLRSSGENAATGLINAILRQPQSTAADLARDVERGAEPGAVLALLDAAANLARLRGIKIDPFVRAMRARLSPPAPPGARSTAGAAPQRPQRKDVRSWLRAWLPWGRRRQPPASS